MLYVPLDAEYASDPKIIRAGAMAELVYVRALALAKRLMEDGYIDSAHLPQLALGIKGDPQTHVSALVREGLWAQERDGWLIVAWEKRNMTRAQIEERKQKKRDAAVKGNHDRWHIDGKTGDDCPHCIAGANQLRSQEQAAPNHPVSPEPEPEPKGEPEPSPLPQSSPGASTRALPDYEDQTQQVFDEYIAIRRQGAGIVRNPDAWRRTVVANLMDEGAMEKIIRWQRDFDVSPREMACALIDGVPRNWSLSRKASA